MGIWNLQIWNHSHISQGKITEQMLSQVYVATRPQRVKLESK